MRQEKILPLNRIPAFDESREREFFIYNAPFHDLVSDVEQLTQIEISGDADFEIQKISCAYYVYPDVPFNLSAVVQGQWPLRMINISNGESLFQNFDFGSIQASARAPFILPDPEPVKAKSVWDVYFTWKNMPVPSISFLNIAFIGAKVYP